jgi:hypothetical protein
MLNYIFSIKLQYAVENTENNVTGTAAIKVFKNYDFPMCIKLGLESGAGSGSASKWKFGSGLAENYTDQQH